MTTTNISAILREIAEGVGAILFIALMVASALALAAHYGNEMYGDWRCGIPGVQCQKVVLP